MSDWYRGINGTATGTPDVARIAGELMTKAMAEKPPVDRWYGPVFVRRSKNIWWARIGKFGPGIKAKRIDGAGGLLFSEWMGSHAAIIVGGWYVRYVRRV